MKSSQQKEDLEALYFEHEKQAVENSIVLGQKQFALKHALKSLSEAQIRWKLHKQNRKHVKNQADFVDLREYKGSLRLGEKAKEALEDQLRDVSRLKADVKDYKDRVADAEARKKAIDEELGKYGQVVQFRSNK